MAVGCPPQPCLGPCPPRSPPNAPYVQGFEPGSEWSLVRPLQQSSSRRRGRGARLTSVACGAQAFSSARIWCAAGDGLYGARSGMGCPPQSWP